MCCWWLFTTTLQLGMWGIIAWSAMSAIGNIQSECLCGNWMGPLHIWWSSPKILLAYQHPTLVPMVRGVCRAICQLPEMTEIQYHVREMIVLF